MRINAYILAADPAWIEASVLSYYDMVNKIVVSYDDSSTSWTGTPIPVEECLSRLGAIDRDKKMIYSPGHYARLDHHPMENDTYQRQCALDEAGKDADWVLQLDTDEVLMSPSVFGSCLGEADLEDFQAVLYPARWIYQRAGPDKFLEACDRIWRVRADFPGPVAVRSGVRLKHARQCEARTFRADYSLKSKTPVPTGDPKVHRAVAPAEAIAHFSWVRSEEEMRRKTAAWGHSNDRDWSGPIETWLAAARHPRLCAAMAPFSRSGGRFRLVHLAPMPGTEHGALRSSRAARQPAGAIGGGPLDPPVAGARGEL